MAVIKNKTMLKITIPVGSGLVMPLVFQQDAAHHVWVDWGDKSYPDTYTYQGLVEAKHTYPAAGEYTITMEVVDDGWLVLGGGWTGGNFVGGSDEAAARMLTALYVGDDVTGIADYAFRGCENLETVTFPRNAEITLGVSAFEGCISLESIVIPSNLATIPKSCFSSCTDLRKVTLPTGIYEIEPFAFYNCANLREINLTPVTHIGIGAFAFCRKLTEVTLGSNAFKIESDAFGNCSCLRKVVLGSTKTIGDRAFYGAKSLQSIDMPDTLTSIGGMAFAACSSLKRIKMAVSNPLVLMSPKSIEANDALTVSIPRGSIRKYVNATNWTLLEGKFVEEG